MDFGGLGLSDMVSAVTAPISMGYNIYANERARHDTATQNRLSRDFIKEMSDTEVQRRTQDLIKAGLSPVLAAGAAASTPSVNPGQSNPNTITPPDPNVMAALRINKSMTAHYDAMVEELKNRMANNDLATAASVKLSDANAARALSEASEANSRRKVTDWNLVQAQDRGTPTTQERSQIGKMLDEFISRFKPFPHAMLDELGKELELKLKKEQEEKDAEEAEKKKHIEKLKKDTEKRSKQRNNFDPFDFQRRS